mmetsp:Transcript_17202/g.19607  ORF Transcript_17202/g.19607 Transcript_17202/m.19607 type:complete len:99 (+) Transcript_17202:38-334(+)
MSINEHQDLNKEKVGGLPLYVDPVSHKYTPMTETFKEEIQDMKHHQEERQTITGKGHLDQRDLAKSDAFPYVENLVNEMQRDTMTLNPEKFPEPTGNI